VARQYWLIKSEPSTYPYDKLVKDGRTVWDGVRNFTARNNLRAMKEGDLAFFYHSNVGKEIVGAAIVLREAYPDPTAKDEDWSVVDFGAAFPLKKPVTLETMKKGASRWCRYHPTTSRASSPSPKPNPRADPVALEQDRQGLRDAEYLVDRGDARARLVDPDLTQRRDLLAA
jgi:predicted RNA-binding protein with PUA-like domain